MTSLARQLRSCTDDLAEAVIPDGGHIVPVDGLSALLPLLADFSAPWDR
ncbi:hypothetical protein [Nocardia brasiliensis]|nr:hypothetical protein [Nocardia brasiliensis]